MYLACTKADSFSEKKGENVTFREVVEEFAREKDISFRPRLGSNATMNGKQVFLFGDSPIYLESNVVYALKAGEWLPTALDKLVSST